MKRILTIGMMMCLVCALIMCMAGFPVSASEDVEEIEKVYWEGTIDDLFTEKEVCVVIHPDWYEKEYTVEDFADINCVSVKVSATGKVNGRLVQLLLVTIADEGKQSVLDAVRQLETRADIYAAHPNILVPETGETALLPVATTMLLLSGTALAVLLLRKRKYR